MGWTGQIEAESKHQRERHADGFLHKQIGKTKKLQIAFNKWEAEHPEELAKKRERQVGEMKSLGLLVKNK